MSKHFELEIHQSLNRSAWDAKSVDYESVGENKWKRSDPVWGIWEIPNDELPLLPPDLNGSLCLEIGCGTGYVSAWIAKRGGHSVGMDPSNKQLVTALRLREEHGGNVEFVQSFGESLPFASHSFDFCISEYGASLWADPCRWVPEAARVLKSNSPLVFMTCHPIAQLCAPDDESTPHGTNLLRAYLGMYRLNWSDPDTVEFQLTHGDWIDLLHDSGFAVEKLIEVGAPKNGQSRYEWASKEWGQSWPLEEVWFARKR